MANTPSSVVEIKEVITLDNIQELIESFIQVDENIYNIQDDNAQEELTKQYHDILDKLLVLVNKNKKGSFEDLDEWIIDEVLNPIKDDIYDIELSDIDENLYNEIKKELDQLIQDLDGRRNEGTDVEIELNSNQVSSLLWLNEVNPSNSINSGIEGNDNPEKELVF